MSFNNEEAIKRDIDQAKHSRLKLQVEILGGNRCRQAEQLNGKIYTLESIVKRSILPYAECERIGGCNCTYLFQPMRDAEGKLLKK